VPIQFLEGALRELATRPQYGPWGRQTVAGRSVPPSNVLWYESPGVRVGVEC
jgi:hypothetical protein